jgi:hypothetical protein
MNFFKKSTKKFRQLDLSSYPLAKPDYKVRPKVAYLGANSYFFWPESGTVEIC